MTAPVPAGYPDFGRTFSEAQILEISDPSGNASTTVQYPIRYVGNAKALLATLVSGSMGLELQFTFYTDNIGSFQTGNYIIHALTNDAVAQPIPILSPYMSAQLVPAAGGAFTYSLEVWRTPYLATFAGESFDLSLWSQDNQPISAGATLTFDCGTVLEGPATWAVAVGGSVFTAKVFAVNFTGTTTLLDMANGSSPFNAPRALWLPPSHVRCTVKNESASAQTFTLTGTRRRNR